MYGSVVRALSRSCLDIDISERLGIRIREPGDSSPDPFSLDGLYVQYIQVRWRPIIRTWFLISSFSFFDFESSTSHLRALILFAKVWEMHLMDRGWSSIQKARARCKHNFLRELVSKFIVLVSAVRKRLLARENNVQGLNRIRVLPSGLSKRYIVRLQRGGEYFRI